MNHRFFDKVRKYKNGCWIWRAYHDRYGYGKFHWKKRGLPISAHRASWIIHKGKIPKNKCILHKCDKPLCVRPDHLFMGNQIDNIRDMVKKRRNRTCRGEANFNSKLSAKEVRAIRNLRKKGTLYRILSQRFDVTTAMIGHIINGRAWRHLS